MAPASMKGIYPLEYVLIELEHREKNLIPLCSFGVEPDAVRTGK